MTSRLDSKKIPDPFTLYNAYITSVLTQLTPTNDIMPIATITVEKKDIFYVQIREKYWLSKPNNSTCYQRFAFKLTISQFTAYLQVLYPVDLNLFEELCHLILLNVSWYYIKVNIIVLLRIRFRKKTILLRNGENYEEWYHELQFRLYDLGLRPYIEKNITEPVTITQCQDI